MAFPAAAYDALLRATGVPVVYGSTSVYGKLRREPADVMNPDGLRGTIIITTLLVRDGVLPNLLLNAPIVVNGAPFRIRDCGAARPDGGRLLELAPG